MRRIRNKLHPVGGMWTYVQPETGVKLQDWNWNAFVKRVRDHREACGIPLPAAWVDELEEAVIAANPKISYDEDTTRSRRFTGSDIKRSIEKALGLLKVSSYSSQRLKGWPELVVIDGRSLLQRIKVFLNAKS